MRAVRIVEIRMKKGTLQTKKTCRIVPTANRSKLRIARFTG